MIKFAQVQEPAEFGDKKTSAIVADMAHRLSAGKKRRPTDIWSPFKHLLADGYRQLCAYSAMYEPVGTVDHFVSCDEDYLKSYEWSNYRFASAWINSSKQHLRAAEILDPNAIDDGWFKILLPSLQLVVTDRIPEQLRERAEFVLRRLHLGHDERVLRQRREWYRMYQSGEITLEGLARKAPLIAEAVRREGAA